MSGFRFWGSSCASERNWISLPLPIKQDTVIYHLQFTMLCIYIFSTNRSSRSFCSSLLHNSITEMLCTDTGALHAACITAWVIHLSHSNMGSQSTSQRFQHGFTKIKLHPQTSLLTFYEEITVSVEKDRAVDITCFDISDAFDPITPSLSARWAGWAVRRTENCMASPRGWWLFREW